MKHIPVLVNEVIDNIKDNYKIFFDGTLGHGGHAKEILKVKTNIKKYFGVDKDYKMLEKAKNNLEDFKDKVIFINTSYANIDKVSKQYDVLFDGILLDLGVNLEHFKDPNRGFSIKFDGPLDMRFDLNQNFTAKDLINNYSLNEFVDIFQKYGDFSEKFSKFIANNIIDTRKKMKIHTTFDFKKILKNIGLNDRKIAVIFQTIRIQVNKELENLEIFLDKFHKYLNIDGRCYIITYHSIEDRLVKNKFKELKNKGKFELINKHVIKPNWQEIKQNKAARSAKLRIIEKVF